MHIHLFSPAVALVVWRFLEVLMRSDAHNLIGN